MAIRLLLRSQSCCGNLPQLGPHPVVHWTVVLLDLVSMQIIGVTFDVPRIDRGIEAFEYKQRWKHGKLFDSINNY